MRLELQLHHLWRCLFRLSFLRWDEQNTEQGLVACFFRVSRFLCRQRAILFRGGSSHLISNRD